MMNFVSKKLNNKRGFTLIELIVVIAIIGILVLLATPKFLGYTKDAQVASMQADAKVLSNAALQYNIKNHGDWPIGSKIVPEAEERIREILDVNEYEDLEFYAIDKDKVKAFVKNTSEDIDNYVLLIDGDFQGEVFHVDGKTDSEGIYHNGVYKLEVKIPA